MLEKLLVERSETFYAMLWVVKNPANTYDLHCYHGTNISSLNNLKHLSAWLYNLLHRSKWDRQSIFTLKARIMKKMMTDGPCLPELSFLDLPENILHKSQILSEAYS